MSHEKRTDWLLRQFVQGIETRLRIGDLREPEARMVMTERMVPRHVQQRVIDRVGMAV